MTIQVLVSTMNQTNINGLVKDMHVYNCVVINQITEKIKTPRNHDSKGRKYLSFKEKGLSKSRNRAIKYSNADICVIADDDMYYEHDYEKIIKDAYLRIKDADIIAFYIDDENTKTKKKMQKAGRVKLLKTMKLSSVQLTFRRNSIINKNIEFNEGFGSGTKKYMGEENIFLTDCLKKNLRVYYVPTCIATLNSGSVSTWFNGYNNKYLRVKGAVFYRMSSYLFPLLILQFAIRKRELFNKKISTLRLVNLMFEGASNEKKHSN